VEDDQVVHASLFAPTDGKALGIRGERSQDHSRGQGLHRAHVVVAGSSCSIECACFLKRDPAEAHPLHQESEWLTFDNGNEQLGRCLYQKVWESVRVRWEVAASEDVS
jgi:hypothetical protein